MLAWGEVGRRGNPMENWHGLARRRPDQALPAEIYVSLVNALYNDFRSLFVGAIAASPARR